MARLWRLLVNCVTLVAFMASNSANLHAHNHVCDGACIGIVNGEPEAKRSGCKCRHSSEARLTVSSSQSALVPFTEDGKDSCPCHDSKSDNSCPCPGGCVHCSVAKTLCKADTIPLLVSPVLVSNNVPAVLPEYLSQAPEGMFRPPRV